MKILNKILLTLAIGLFAAFAWILAAYFTQSIVVAAAVMICAVISTLNGWTKIWAEELNNADVD